jgi:hypothetical protein
MELSSSSGWQDIYMFTGKATGSSADSFNDRFRHVADKFQHFYDGV